MKHDIEVFYWKTNGTWRAHNKRIHVVYTYGKYVFGSVFYLYRIGDIVDAVISPRYIHVYRGGVKRLIHGCADATEFVKHMPINANRRKFFKAKYTNEHDPRSTEQALWKFMEREYKKNPHVLRDGYFWGIDE